MSAETTFQRIKAELDSSAVVIYTDGTPMFPMDSKSASAIQVLEAYKIKYLYVDTLKSSSLKDGIKSFSGNSDMPQLFINKKFIASGREIEELEYTGKLKDILIDCNIDFEEM